MAKIDNHIWRGQKPERTSTQIGMLELSALKLLPLKKITHSFFQTKSSMKKDNFMKTLDQQGLILASALVALKAITPQRPRMLLDTWDLDPSS